MTENQFIAEVSAALAPIIQRYAEANRNDPQVPGFLIGTFAGYAVGIGAGAGLGKTETLLLATMGARGGWDTAIASLDGGAGRSTT